jgi:hypothetical protein
MAGYRVNFTFLPLSISIERISGSYNLMLKVQHRNCSIKVILLLLLIIWTTEK